MALTTELQQLQQQYIELVDIVKETSAKHEDNIREREEQLSEAKS